METTKHQAAAVLVAAGLLARLGGFAVRAAGDPPRPAPPPPGPAEAAGRPAFLASVALMADAPCTPPAAM